MKLRARSLSELPLFGVRAGLVLAVLIGAPSVGAASAPPDIQKAADWKGDRLCGDGRCTAPTAAASGAVPSTRAASDRAVAIAAWARKLRDDADKAEKEEAKLSALIRDSEKNADPRELARIRAELHDGAEKMSPGGVIGGSTVDHRTDGTEGPVRNQGDVGACTAFSFAAAADHALRRAGSTTSIALPWSRYKEAGMQEVIRENLRTPLRSLDNEGSNFGPTVIVTAVTPVFGARRIQPITSFLLGPHRAEAINPVSHANDPGLPEMNALANALQEGHDIWIAMAAGGALEDDQLLRNYDGLPAVVRGFTGGSPGHAMVLAGYADRPGGRYFLLHNSWGAEWGDHGYAWIHQETLRRNIFDAYTVDARVSDVTLPQYPSVRYNGQLVPGFQGFEPTPPATLCFGGHAVQGFGDSPVGGEEDKWCR